MSANLISSVRTGCVPGVGVRHLARKDAEVCTCIGAGPVSKACFDAIRSEAKNLKEVVIYDLFKEKSEAFANEVRQRHGAYPCLLLEVRRTSGYPAAVASAWALRRNPSAAWKPLPRSRRRNASVQS